MFNILKKKNNSISVVNDEKTLQRRTVNILNTLEGILAKSYGPLGSNTIINNSNDRIPIITKDGYNILRSLKFNNSIDESIHFYIKQISYNLVKKVGDGSTSAVIAACILYKSLLPLLDKFESRKALIKMLDIAGRLIDHSINDNLKLLIDDKNRERVLTSVAEISNNNDLEIGKSIAKLFIKIPDIMSIKIEEDKRDIQGIHTSIKYGFSYDRGPCHGSVLKDKTSITIKDPRILFTYELNALLFKELTSNLKQPMVIIAGNIHNDVEVEYIKYNITTKEPNLYIIRTFGLDSHDFHDDFIDLAIYLDSDIISMDNDGKFREEQLGSCKEVYLSPNNTIFYSGQGFNLNTEIYDKRISDLKEHHSTLSDNEPALRGRLKARLNKLQGVSATIQVGGRTAEEKQTNMYLVEDAVLACRSVLDHGYTFGGNLGVFYAIDKLFLLDETTFLEQISDDNLSKDDIKMLYNILDIFSDSFLELYMKLFTNMNNKLLVKNIKYKLNESCLLDDKGAIGIFNLKTKTIESIYNTNVLAPVKTDIEIIKGTLSILGILLTANQFIS